MIADTEISLIKPTLDLTEELRLALSESYPELTKFLLWPVPDPSAEAVRENIQQAIINFENHLNEYRYLTLRNSDTKFEARLHSDRVLSDGSIENSLIYFKVYP